MVGDDVEQDVNGAIRAGIGVAFLSRLANTGKAMKKSYYLTMGICLQ